MAIYDGIKHSERQFLYRPKIENEPALKKIRRRVNSFIVAGMGGSHLGEDILESLDPRLNMTKWNDYGLPPMPVSELRKKLVIASSYSGNTAETVDAFLEAKRRGIPLAAIATGGRLIALAKKFKVPYVEMPDRRMQPRMALGLNLRSLLKLIGHGALLRDSDKLAKLLHPGLIEPAGKKLARRLKGSVPVVYTSLRNVGLAYNWKIKFNETGKIPAFYNLFPELNHNEMTGFDAKSGNRGVSSRFHFIFLKDSEDDPRIQKRMRITEALYRQRGFKVESPRLAGRNRLHKIFSSLILADWAAYHTACLYGADPEQIPMVEDFKKRIG